MKRLLTIIMLLLTAQTLFVSANDDLSKSKGTEQEVIVSLSPAPAQTQVSRDDDDDDDNKGKTQTIKKIAYRFAVTDVQLQSIAVSPATIDMKEGATVQLSATGHYDNGNEKNLTAQVEWSAGDGDVAGIDANGTLTALKEGMTTLAATINGIDGNASLIVYKEIHAHRLPPEPDPAINNSTLLGIDINNNGVRDDVERWIYENYKDKHPIHIDIAMQVAKAYKKVLENPENAREIYPIVDAATWCEGYYKVYAKYFNKPLLVDTQINNRHFRYKIMFNTKERLEAYLAYDALLSGVTYSTPLIDMNMSSYCDFNTSSYGNGL